MCWVGDPKAVIITLSNVHLVNSEGLENPTSMNCNICFIIYHKASMKCHLAYDTLAPSSLVN